jgi:hypothetical protein
MAIMEDIEPGVTEKAAAGSESGGSTRLLSKGQPLRGLPRSNEGSSHGS